MNLWLSYVSYPITTAVYLEKAFRKNHRVTTIGPQVTSEQLTQWGIDPLLFEISAQEIPTGNEPDLLEILKSAPFPPDFFIWIESVHGFFPRHIDQLPCPTACYLIDNHLNFEWHKHWAKQFDFVFIAQKEYLDDFRAAGIHAVHWLPLACDPEMHCPTPSPQIREISFVGAPHKGFPREKLLHQIAAHFPLFQKRAYREEMSQIFAESKIIFNRSLKNDLNMRVFEAMASGSLLLTDDPGIACGQSELFTNGEDYLIYNENNLLSLIDEFLKNDLKREAIGRSGKDKILHAHTYEHRSSAMLDVLEGVTVSTPDPQQWRALSQGHTDRYFLGETPWRGAILPSRPQRSFILPLLDQSPTNTDHIQTLLKDLETIDGNLILICHTEKMAELYSQHHRVTLSATLSQNVGLTRSWNLGFHLCETPIAYFLNPYHSLKTKIIPRIERTLLQIDQAAVVGAQGSFFNFFGTTNFQNFSQGIRHRPLKVDAISPFFFAIKRSHFLSGALCFEDDYTPCSYFEGWDLGLQCREKGLECWIAPTSEEENSSIQTVQTEIVYRYFDRQESIQEIEARNRKRFQSKWLERAKRTGNFDLFCSHYPEYLKGIAEEMNKQSQPLEAEKLLQKSRSILEQFDRCFNRFLV